jgi:hypothetical protein
VSRFYSKQRQSRHNPPHPPGSNSGRPLLRAICKPSLTLLSHLVLFSPFRSLCPRPLSLDCGRVSPNYFYSGPTFRCHPSLPLVLYSLSYYPCLHRSLRLLQMGRKRTAEDYQQTAEEDGWIAGCYNSIRRAISRRGWGVAGAIRMSALGTTRV